MTFVPSPGSARGWKRFTTAVLLLILALSPSLTHSQTSAHHPGRWSLGSNWVFTPIHLNLLRGRDSLHSQILWWQAHRPPHDQYPGFAGGLWGWRPLDTANDSLYPSAAFVSLTNLMVNTPDSNIFCSGHTQLADRLLVLGGTALGSPENGGKFNRTFDPMTRSWDSIPDMSYRRWYPTGTLLATGEAVVSSGSQFSHLYVFGGRKPTGAFPIDETCRYGFVGEGQWDLPVEDTTNFPSSPDTLEPMPREGHTFTAYPLLLFGGLDSTGTFRNDVWRIEPVDIDPQAADYQYQWTTLPPGEAVPLPRSEHAAVVLPDNSIVIYGGRSADGETETVHGDVWRVVPQLHSCVWNVVEISGSSPSPRFGHGMAALKDTVLMFGGIGGIGQNATDTTLWRLRFTDAPNYENAVWEQVSVSGVAPAPRWDHTLTTDPALNDRGPRNLVLFGGRGQFGGGATLSAELWRLWVNGSSISWARQDTVLGVPPAARGGHAASMNTSTRQMLLMGGETASGPGADTSVYILRLSEPGPHPVWRQTSPPGGPRLSNLAAVLGDGPFARISEIYDPFNNEWTALDAPLLQAWYPFIHLTPDAGYGGRGRLFYSGPNPDSYWLDPTTPSWTKLNSPTPDVGGGAAVMYRPGKVMKAGAGLRDSAAGNPSHGRTRHIDLMAGSPAWHDSGSMLPRFNHNLVILASGQVLAVGGTDTIGNDEHGGVTRPEIWDPATARWYGATGAIPLAEDSYLRDYHSSAILLPDARVLSTGGNANDVTKSFANIYTPPYLFTAGGALAARPQITHAPARIRYGKKFMILSPTGTWGKKPCLIRPGAATHGFDQNQRYVPLTVDTTLSSSSQLIVTAPPDSFTAPPGDRIEAGEHRARRRMVVLP